MPPPLPGDQLIQISAGAHHTCAVNPAETTCWGNVGRLVGSSRTAFPGAIPRSAGYQAVSAGFEHVCMQTSVSGYTDVNCLGRNQFGQTTHDPAELPLLVGGGNIKFRALAAGLHHTCGISTTNQIFCWGMNDRAQFGRGDVGGWHWLPQLAAPVRL